MPQLLHDEFLRGKEVLVVAGTHGKTTTTSMLAWIFHSAGLASVVPDRRHRRKFRLQLPSRLRQALHPRRRRIRHRLLRQRPEVPALFSRLGDSDFGRVRSRRHLQRSRRRRDRLQAPGESDPAPRTHRSLRRIRGGATESPSLERCLAKAFCPVERYGAGPRANWKVTNLRLEPARTAWTVLRDGQPWADLEFPLAGEYNVWNATAAAALAASCGIPKDAIAAALKTFKSVKRRLEVKAQVNGITIIDDFAHHPTAIAGTLKALRARYPGARLWAILEPRSNTLRRRILQTRLGPQPGAGRRSHRRGRVPLRSRPGK